MSAARRIKFLENRLNAPKSVQVARYLISEIQSGNLKPGQRLESVRKLAERYGVGRQVVLSAFIILAKQNFICTEVGRGTFVNPEIRQGYYYRLGYFVNRNNPLNGETAWKLRGVALRHGWQMILGTNFEEDFELIDWVHRKKDLDGVIISGSVEEETLKDLDKNCIPYVVLGDYKIKEQHPQVKSKFPENSSELMKRLVKQHGLNSMAAFFGPEYLLSEKRVSSAVEQAFKDLGWKPGQGQIIHARDDSYPEISKIMEHNPPEAFFFLGEHCMGWRKYLHFHPEALENHPLIIIRKDWTRILARKEYDIIYDFDKLNDQFIEAAFLKMMEILQIKTDTQTCGGGI